MPSWQAMFRFFQNPMRSLDSLLNLITDLVVDGLLFFRLLLRSRTALSVEVLFLRKQLAFYGERQVQPRRLNDYARFSLILWSRLCDWKEALVIVKPETLGIARVSSCFGKGNHKPVGHEFLRTSANSWCRSENQDTLSRFDRVSKLIHGFETPYGMELLSTVHWVATRENDGARFDPEAAISAVHNWSEQKKQSLRPDHIRQAWKRLKDQNWI